MKYFLNLRNDEILIFGHKYGREVENFAWRAKLRRYAEFDMTELERTDELQHYLD